MTANVGIAERADRLVAVLAATGLVGLGLPEILLTVVLALLAVASLVTVVQRMLVGAPPGPRRGVSALAERASLAATALGWYLVRRMPGALGLPHVRPHRRRRRGAVAAPGCAAAQQLRAGAARARAGRADALVREGMRSYLRYWCDAFRLPDVGLDQLVQTVRTEGDGPVREQLATGRGAVMFLGHLGNWDTGGAWSTTQLAPVTTVAERLRPEELFDEFLAFRESLGMRIIPLTGGNDVFRELLVGAARRRVRGPARRPRPDPGRRRGRPVRRAAPGWRSGRPRSRWPPGRRCTRCRSSTSGRGPARRPAAPGRHPLPRPGAGARERHHPRARSQQMTQACADVVGATIREHTQDWHMMQRVFVDDLTERPAALRRPGVRVRIGMVCPYSFDVPGGVQFHVRDLAEYLLAQGHEVSVLAPADDDTPCRTTSSPRAARSRSATTARWPGSPSAR